MCDHASQKAQVHAVPTKVKWQFRLDHEPCRTVMSKLNRFTASGYDYAPLRALNHHTSQETLHGTHAENRHVRSRAEVPDQPAREQVVFCDAPSRMRRSHALEVTWGSAMQGEVRHPRRKVLDQRAPSIRKAGAIDRKRALAMVEYGRTLSVQPSDSRRVSGRIGAHLIERGKPEQDRTPVPAAHEDRAALEASPRPCARRCGLDGCPR